MHKEPFAMPERWPLIENHIEALRARLETWASRVQPYIETLAGDEKEQKEAFLKWLESSMDRGDLGIAIAIDAMYEHARSYIEGPGPYDRGGGSMESLAGGMACQNQFVQLYDTYVAYLHDAPAP